MSQEEFGGLSNEALARVWFALGLAETRHPGEFTGLRDAAFTELGVRFDATALASFLDEHLPGYGRTDSGDRAAPGTSPAADTARPVRDTYPA